MSTHRLGKVCLSSFTWPSARAMNALMLSLTVRVLVLTECGCRDGAHADALLTAVMLA